MALTSHSSLPPGYRTDSRLGPVYEMNQRNADDLTVIHGIETREAVGLNHLGIYYYDQIAAWSDQQVTAVADTLGMSAAAIFRNRWIEQAWALISPPPLVSSRSASGVSTPQEIESLPASGSRTVTVLVCALLVGCFIVSWLNRQAHPPLSAVLAAEITSLRVPTDSRLLTTHVSAGDEVFTGETLLTLEKSEHVELIAQQAQLVQSLERELRKAEAQASIDLKWREQVLQNEVSETRTRARLFETLQPLTTSMTTSPETRSTSALLQTVSHPTRFESRSTDMVNSLLFISGISGSSNLSSQTAQRSVATEDETKDELVLPSPADDLLRLEVQRVTARLEQLEQIRRQLPGQVRQAAGVETLRARYQQETTTLTQMQELSRETAVLCPGYGTVGRVRYRAGDRMARGEVMLKIQHTDRRYLIVHATAEQLAELQPGSNVRVRFAGHDECEGLVVNLPTVADKSASDGRSVTSVRVEPVGRSWPAIPIGSQAKVLVQ
jgi:multidrug resistance efflux pump